MLFLLRKIRRKTLKNNKFTTYLLYALGEIVLVVVGILIAVNIDDWNNGRKNSELQVEILKSLHSDIGHNVEKIKSVIQNESLLRTRSMEVLKIVTNPKSTYHDSLKVYFGAIGRYDVFQPRKMAYEAYKSKGLEIIANDSLRSEIIKLYDEVYTLNPLILDIKKDIHIMTLALSNKRFLTLKDPNLKVPNDFESLKSDIEFINHLSYVAGESSNFLRHYDNMLTVTQSVQNSIGVELEKLNKN